MVTLFFDDHHRVLLVRMSGRITMRDVEHNNKATHAFAAREGQVRTIVDGTDIEGVDLPNRVLSHLGSRPPAMGQQARVIVAPGLELFGLGRMYATYQEANGHREPVLVRSLEEAYRAFDMVGVKFQPVADTSVLRRAAPQPSIGA